MVSDLEPISRKSIYFFGLRKLFCVCCVCIQDQSFNNFENNTMDLSVNEEKLTGVWSRNCDTIQQVLILKFASGPKSYRVFRDLIPFRPNNARACYSGLVNDHQFNQ